MIKSDKILPIRFYDDLYDQSRFSRNCHDTCQLKLNYPTSKLPHFQVKRDSIFASPSNFFLRNVCNDIDNNYYKDVPEGVDNFCNKDLAETFLSQTFPWEVALETTDPPANYLVDLFDIDCCKIKMLSANIPNNPTVGYILLSNPILSIPITSNTDQYHFKIIIDKMVGTSTIQVKNGGNLLGIISSAGVYEYTFTSTATTIELVFDTISYGDYLEINYIQATKLMFNTILTNDVQLDPSSLSVVNLKDGTDIIVYCADKSYTSNIEFGQYYYVIKSGNEFYFSEVFELSSLRKIEELYKLKWYNDCDLNDSVLYSSDSIPCQYENVIYLDAGLIKPEYDTQEESEVNGEGDLNVRFKRWQKNITFEIGKSPEFLTDALSAVFIHDNITLLEALKYRQDVQNNELVVLKSTSDISDIFSSCYQSVNLKLLLEDKITDTSCCNLADIIDCDPCKYNAGTSPEDCADGYYLTIVDGNGSWWTSGCDSVPRYKYTLTDCEGNVINTRPTDVICYNGQYINLDWFEGENCFGTATVSFYYAKSIAPVLATAAFAFIGFYITGTLIPNTWGQAYFQIGCTGPWILADTFKVGDDGSFVFLYPADLLSPYLPFTCICFKVVNVTPNCEFGETDSMQVGAC